MRKLLVGFVLLFAGIINVSGQQFFNLTSDDVKIDRILPCFQYSYPLGVDYSDSIYSISIEYPEYMDMSEQDILKYKSITSDTLPSSPIISQNVSLDKDKGFLDISFIPIVYRNGKYQKIVRSEEHTSELQSPD